MPSPYKKSFAAEQRELRPKKKTGLWIFLAIVGVVVVVGGYALYSRFVAVPADVSETGKITSIAVLPFEDMSPNKDQDHLGDGIAEMILNALTNVKALRVIARTSSFQFTGRENVIGEIGKKLDVNWILEGSVNKEADQIRITAQLIRVADESHIWSQKYDRDFKSVLSIQEEISQEILKEMKFTLMGEEKAAVVKRYTNDPDAYELYLLGRQNWKELEYNIALDYFQKAVEKDPDFALAYSGIADVYSRMGLGGMRRPHEFYPKAKEAAQKALEIDDTIAEAHTSLAWINLNYDWDWSAAEREFKRAIELNPGYFSAHWWYVDYLEITRQFNEALKEIEICKELNPQMSAYVRRKAGILVNLGRYDEAIALIDKTIEENPDYTGFYFIAKLYFAEGKYKNKAIDAIQKLNRDDNKMILGYFYGVIGERGKAEQIIDEFIKQKKESYIPSSIIAWLFAGLDETDKVFEWLNKAYEEHDSLLPWINFLYAYDNLRSDPRFKELLKKKMELQE